MEDTSARVRRIYADNIEMKSRIEVLERQVRELFERLEEGRKREQRKSLEKSRRREEAGRMILDGRQDQAQQQQQIQRKAESSTSKIRPVAVRHDSKLYDTVQLSTPTPPPPPSPPPGRRNRSKQAEPASHVVSPISPLSASTQPAPPSSEIHTTAPSSTSQQQRTEYKALTDPQLWLRDYLLHMARRQLTLADNLVSYCATFKSTADALPLTLLDSVSRSRIFLAGLAEGVREEVQRRCCLESEVQGWMDFEGIFVVVSLVVRRLGLAGGRGKGLEEWGREQVEGEMELVAEVGRAWERHREFVEGTGMLLPGLDV